MKKALICGVSGQDGAYLAELLLSKGYQVYGSSRDAQASRFNNLELLGISNQVEKISIVLTDFRSVLQALSMVKPDEIYNLAGQSSVGLSFQQPVEAMESIAIGTLNLLESVRFLDQAVKIYNAGSGECFGDTGDVVANEDAPFKPRSPYAVAKSAAHWEVANYRESYGLFACTGILFNHESPLRPRRFVTSKIISAACDIARGDREKLLLGNLNIHRDWGWAPEYVDAMWRMMQLEEPQDFIVCTGKTNSLETFCQIAFSELGLDWEEHVVIDKSLYRPSDILISKGDASKARGKLEWEAQVSLKEVIRRMIAHDMQSANHQ